ncbi:unnamed protein product [Porites evermanni]|uniref:Uncharacterized protein n=1 Tax=Porites evermanni TaxID=104178 RepID=A0ABN8M0D3_9CNID|nr:unnamed protein product [Porites evermanni]
MMADGPTQHHRVKRNLLPSHIAASCLPPAGIKHGVHIGNDYGHGKTVRFQCDREYTLEGRARVTCTDGKWDSDPPNCKGIYYRSAFKYPTQKLTKSDDTIVYINECSTNSHSCDVNAVCGNTLGSYTCACKPGYSGNGRTCSDINECSTNSHSCDVNAVCGNTLGSYTCACKPGYSGNGRTCSDIDECTTNSHSCDVNAVCSNTVGSYACACKAGFTGDGNTCTGEPFKSN